MEFSRLFYPDSRRIRRPISAPSCWGPWSPLSISTASIGVGVTARTGHAPTCRQPGHCPSATAAGAAAGGPDPAPCATDPNRRPARCAVRRDTADGGLRRFLSNFIPSRWSFRPPSASRRQSHSPAMLLPSLLEGERKSCAVWYVIFRQSPEHRAGHWGKPETRRRAGGAMRSGRPAARDQPGRRALTARHPLPGNRPYNSAPSRIISASSS
jgi:hypothetical protein